MKAIGRSNSGWFHFPLGWLCGCLLIPAVQAIQYSVAVPFTLLAGETVFGLALPQFSLSSYTLNSVSVTVDASFGADLTVFGSASDLTYSWSLGSASPASPKLTITPLAAGALAPGALTFLLSGSQLVTANGSASFHASQAGSTVLSATDTATLNVYRGTGTVGYDLDVTALYAEMVSTVPTSANAIFANARVSGQVTITYDATPPPTGIPYSDLSASWAGSDHVVVQWVAHFAPQAVRFLLERRVDDGDWSRVGSSSFPVPTDAAPVLCRFDDMVVAASGKIAYRLVEVTRDGILVNGSVVPVGVGLSGTIRQTGLGLELQVQGPADAELWVEAVGELSRGGWVPIGEIRLDDHGSGNLVLGDAQEVGSRFYRLVRK